MLRLKGMKRNLIIVFALATAAAAFARQPEQGYRGFVESTTSVTREPSFLPNVKENCWYTGLSTSHGYQFTPWLFVGPGISLEYNNTYNQYIAPLFLDIRGDAKWGVATPFSDVKIGYNMCGGGGIYFSPTVGYRFNWGRKVGINVGAGLTLRGKRVETFDVIVGENGYYEMFYTGQIHKVDAMFSFRVGIDF